MRIFRPILGCLILAVIWPVAYSALEFPGLVLSPQIVLSIAALGGCLVVGWITLRRRNSVTRLIVFIALCAAYLGCLAPLRDQPVSRFRTVYASIQTGMTLEEVHEVINRQFPGQKPMMGRDADQGLALYLVTLDPTLSEAIEVEMHGGRVISKHYTFD